MKLPVGDTTVYALGFGLRAIPTLLRIGWLQLAVLALGVALVSAAGGDVDMGQGGFADEQRVGWRSGLWIGMETIESFALFVPGVLLIVAALIMLLPVYVTLVRIAAGTTDGPDGLVLRWGGREWRTLGAALLLIPISAAVVLVAFLPAIVVAVAIYGTQVHEPFRDSMPGPFFWVASAVALLFVVWFFVRFTLFVPFAAVHDRIAPVAAFRATAGNFWRLLAISILIGVVMVVLELGFGALQVAFGALGSVFGGPGEDTATQIVFATVVVLIDVVLQAYGNLVSTGYSGRAAGVLTAETEV